MLKTFFLLFVHDGCEAFNTVIAILRVQMVGSDGKWVPTGSGGNSTYPLISSRLPFVWVSKNVCM